MYCSQARPWTSLEERPDEVEDDEDEDEDEEEEEAEAAAAAAAAAGRSAFCGTRAPSEDDPRASMGSCRPPCRSLKLLVRRSLSMPTDECSDSLPFADDDRARGLGAPDEMRARRRCFAASERRPVGASRAAQRY